MKDRGIKLSCNILFQDSFDERIYSLLKQIGPKTLSELTDLTGENRMTLFSTLGRLMTRRLIESVSNHELRFSMT